MTGKRLLQLLQIVVLQHESVLRHLRRHPRAGRHAESGQTRPGLHQQSIGMAVVAPLELDQQLATRDTACQTDRAHGGLGARTHQSHHFHAGHEPDDFFRQFSLAFGRCAKRKPILNGPLHRLQNSRMTMSQNHRTPGADVIDEPLSVGIPEIRPLGPLHETRRSAHGAKGAHWRIDATRNHPQGPVKQGLVSIFEGLHRQSLHLKNCSKLKFNDASRR